MLLAHPVTVRVYSVYLKHVIVSRVAGERLLTCPSFCVRSAPLAVDFSSAVSLYVRSNVISARGGRGDGPKDSTS